MSTVRNCTDWKKKTFLSFAQTRLFASQILLDPFGQLNPSLSKYCTLMVSRSRMNRLGCKKLVSEFAGPRSRFEKPPSKHYINHSNWLKAFIFLFSFFLFFKTEIKICVFVGLGIFFYHQPRSYVEVIPHGNSFVRVNVCSV